MLSFQDNQVAKIIFRLFRQATSKQVVQDFLKAKNLKPSAATWDELFDLKILPALEEGTLTLLQLRGLLQQVEECGKQHVFLYWCDAAKAKEMLARHRVEAVAAQMGVQALIGSPLDLELPDAPTIVDVRIVQPHASSAPTGLLVKMVETRTTKVFVGETSDTKAGTLTRTYSVTKKRAVNLAYLQEDGMLELRIDSQDNRSRYQDNVKALRQAVAPLIPIDGFGIVSLSVAKKKLWTDREALSEQIRYSHSTAKNDFGYVMNVSSSAQEDNLSTDGGSAAAMQSFLESDGHVTGANIYMKIPHTNPQREVHILVTGDLNEFAVPVSCSSSDYEHVRGKILAFNQ